MTEAEAKQLAMCDCQMIYDGIVYRRISYIKLIWDPMAHKFKLHLALEAMCGNSITVAEADRVTPIPLGPEE